jgi:invasion protein IalB
MQALSQSGDWSIICSKTCKASQLLLSENKKLKYSATVSATDEPSLLQLKLVLPLGIYLPANVAFKVDDTAKNIPVTTCIPSGCHALIVINGSLQNKLAKAEFFKIRFFTTSQIENELSFSLKGFNKALESVNTKS